MSLSKSREEQAAALVAKADEAAEAHRLASQAIKGATEVLNSNALIAALFLTFELQLLTGDDTEDYRPLAKRFLLYAMLCSVLLHIICVYIAAEAAFVFSKIKLLPPAGCLAEVRRLNQTRLGASLEHWSGVTFLGGLVFCMVGQAIAAAETHSEHAIDTAIIYITFVGIAVGLYLYAWFGVGAYAAGIVSRHNLGDMTWEASGWQGFVQILDKPALREA